VIVFQRVGAAAIDAFPLIPLIDLLVYLRRRRWLFRKGLIAKLMQKFIERETPIGMRPFVSHPQEFVAKGVVLDRVEAQRPHFHLGINVSHNAYRFPRGLMLKLRQDLTLLFNPHFSPGLTLLIKERLCQIQIGQIQTAIANLELDFRHIPHQAHGADTPMGFAFGIFEFLHYIFKQRSESQLAEQTPPLDLTQMMQ
jgi:hypothetical protein